MMTTTKLLKVWVFASNQSGSSQETYGPLPGECGRNKKRHRDNSFVVFIK